MQNINSYTSNTMEDPELPVSDTEDEIEEASINPRSNYIFIEDGKPRLRYFNQYYTLINKCQNSYGWRCGKYYDEQNQCQCYITTDPTLSYLHIQGIKNPCTHTHELNDEKWDTKVAIQEIIAIALQNGVQAQEAFDQWCLYNKERRKKFHGWSNVKNKVYRTINTTKIRPIQPTSRKHFGELINESHFKFNYYKSSQLQNDISANVAENGLFQIISETKQEYNERLNKNTTESIYDVAMNIGFHKKVAIEQYSAYQLRIGIMKYSND